MILSNPSVKYDTELGIGNYDLLMSVALEVRWVCLLTK